MRKQEISYTLLNADTIAHDDNLTARCQGNNRDLCVTEIFRANNIYIDAANNGCVQLTRAWKNIFIVASMFFWKFISLVCESGIQIIKANTWSAAEEYDC